MPLYQSLPDPQKMPQLRHFFIRHGDNHGPRLTNEGMAEARLLHQLLGRLGLDLDTARAFSADNSQSLHSMALVLEPGTPDSGIASAANHMAAAGRIQLDPRLRYTKFSEHEKHIAADYQTAYDSGTTMKFYVTKSDQYLQANPNLSTYRTIARSMARLVIDRSIGGANTINCGKQFLWPVLRAKLLENRYGEAARDEYVEWYCSSKELTDEARSDINVIHQEPDAFVLQDAYGSFEANVDGLRMLQTGEARG